MRLTVQRLLRQSDGMAVVEATILFPIIIMVFAGFVLLAMYLPEHAILQRITQRTATGLSTMHSDTWVEHTFYSGTYVSLPLEPTSSNRKNVYSTLFHALFTEDESQKAEDTVRYLEETLSLIKVTDSFDNSGYFNDEQLSVSYAVHNYVVYKEIQVTAVREIDMPVNLSFIGFPKTLTVTATSTAAVQNGDEFVRNMDIAVDFTEWATKKLGVDTKIDKVMESVNTFLSKFGI